ncbi:hypothetical protein L2E82_45107 [Cichorium intybus]|uniref:Uncharacterized protein n=1 Tax=Cichorium intybus TaxID=13427 RepID=A0ACB8ZR40_CICIN|nr:hypothetical protein L2E82_45107 [Cichorium intybus]
MAPLDLVMPSWNVGIRVGSNANIRFRTACRIKSCQVEVFAAEAGFMNLGISRNRIAEVGYLDRNEIGPHRAVLSSIPRSALLHAHLPS